MAEEIENEEDQVVEEEEEDVRESDDRQNLDDLTVLNEEADELDDPEGLQQDDDQSDWEEPMATNSLSVIHTGSQPTDAELLANLAPEGETIIQEGEIAPSDEVAGQPLPDVEAPDSDIANPQGQPSVAGADNELPPPPPLEPNDLPAPEEALQQEDVVREAEPAEPAETAQGAAPAAAAPAAVPPSSPPPPTLPPEEDDDVPQEPVETVSATNASGDEDTAIPLSIDPAGADEVVVSGVPEGATLSAGEDNGNGTWTLSAAEVEGLTLTPPADSDEDFTLTVSANGVSVPLDVTVDAVADAPTADGADVTGQEDTAIALDLSAGPGSDTDGSEVLSVEISNIPDGASISVGGVDIPVVDGAVQLTADQLANVAMTPPADFAGEIPLTITSTSTETDGGDTATTQDTFVVTVTDTVDAENATTLEDTAVALTIDPGDASEVVISDVPDGAVFSEGVQNTDGTWTIQAADLEGITLTPPANSDADFTLTITADGFSETMDVSVAAVADTPSVGASDEVGSQDTPIPLDLSAGLTDTDGSETLSVQLSGIPDGAVVSVGGTDLVATDGSVTLTSAQLADVTITPADGFFGEFDLQLTSTSTDTDSDTGDTDVATNATTFTVTVNEAGEFNVTQSEGDEDTAIGLTIDPGDATSVTIENVPDGAMLSAGTEVNGVWTVDAADLVGLTITPPADSDVDFTLAVTADGVTQDLQVAVNAVADAPTAVAEDVAGVEDTAIALDLGSALTDTDLSETLSITITGVPDGAVFSQGVNNGDGTWTIDPADLDGLTVTPPQNFYGEMPLGLTATSTETDGGDSATTSVPFTVTVASDGDFGTTSATGTEDTAISLDIDITNVDGTDLVISDVPDGAVLSAGINNGDGTWTVPVAGVDELTITPAADSDADFTLTITADGISEPLHVTVLADADAPAATANNVIGEEDTPVGLDLASALTDVDGSEVLSVTISDVPTGASFSSGTNNGDGTWTIDPDDLASLTITPPLNFEGEMSLTLNATSTETDGGDTETTSVPFSVTFTPDPDEPNFVVVGAEGDEDTAIPLAIDPGTASEVIISNIPDGATFSAGSDNGDGTWTILADDLDGLTITPPTDSDVDFTLSVSATDADGVTAVGNLDVAVHAVADAPDLNVTSAIGLEDSSIPLNISSALNDIDGSETLSMNISIQGVPDGSVLSAGTDNGDGTWTLTSADLDGLTITPPDDYYGDMTLQVTSTATETNPAEAGDVSVSSATSTATFGVTVRPVSDNPDLNLVDAAGSEDTVIALNISANMGAETTEDLSALNISGVPAGASLSAGTNLGNGIWSFSAEDLAAGALDELTITPADDYNGEFTLTVSAFSSDGGVAVQQMNVDVEAVSDLGITDTASGTEDTAIALNITAAANESVTIGDVPDGAVLSAGTDNGDGTWSLTADQLDGLTITPPENSDVDFALSVYAGDADGTPDGTISVSVAADADAPTLDLTAAAGLEDNAIALEIDPGLSDTDGSETLSISIGDIPAGSILSYVDDLGAVQPITIDGTNATLTTAQLNGLTITPPANFGGAFDLSVSATATETDGGSSVVTSGSMTVDVAAVADAADVAVSDVSGVEDGAIALNIGASGEDGFSSITISGVPDGAELNAGTDNGDGSWTLEPGDLAGLTITPAVNSDVDFALSVTATSVDGDDSTTSAPATLNVSVAADADVPTLDLSLAVGNEDTAIALDIDPGLTDTDGSESLSITIGDIPAGSSLNYVDDQGATQSIAIDGTSATLTTAQLNGLTITPPDNFDGSFDLSVSATSTEADGGDFEVSSGTLSVDVAAVADDAVVATQEAFGTEDQPIALNINATSDDDITSVVISGVPEGASLSAGIENEDGTWTLTADELSGLTVTPPADSSDEFQLSVAVTTTDGSDSTTSTGTLDVNVAGDADAPSLNLFTAAGDEDAAIPLQINAGLSDTDGSETLSITISDVPAGATLNNGTLVSTDPETGVQTWSLDQADLSGLTITPATDASGEFNLSVAVTATEADGDTSTTSGTMTVGVDGVADFPTLDLSTPVSGTEDTAIPLSIDAGLSDASETLSVTIGNIPEGASLSYVDGDGVTQSIDIANGSAQLSAAELNGLSITPPADSSEDFQLSVLATSSDGDDQATRGGVLDVSVTGDADMPTLNLSDVSGAEDTAIALNIDSAVTDTDGSETLSVTISDVPDGASLSAGVDNGNGTWTLSADDLDGLTLTPPTNFDGTINLSVTSTATEADGDTATTSTQTLSIAVTDDNVGPQATDDAFAGSEDGTITFTAEQLLANDTDGNNDALSITDFEQPANGTLTSDGNGNFTFTPDADWSGETNFTYTISDGEGGTSQATVTLDVDGVADAPILSDAVAGGNEDSAIALTLDPALTDTDGSETLSITIGDIPAGATLNYVDGTGQSQAITVTNGSATLEPEQLSGLTITPPENDNGTINLSVTATATEADGGTASTTSTLTVDVAAVNDGPEAVNDTLGGVEDQAFTFTAEQLLANDTDVDGDTLTVQSIEQPDFGTIVDNGNGTYTFTPDENWSGQTDFTYTATDGEGGTSQGTVTVDIGEMNEGPVAVGDTLSGAEDGAITFFPADLLANDTDGDGDTLSITGFEQPDNGTIVENLDGSYTFTPDANWSGETSFTYTISDGEGGSSQASVSIDVDGVADAPVMADASVGGDEDSAIALNIDPGLTDTDGSETLSITVGDIPAGATLNYVDGNGVTQGITVTEGSATLNQDQLNGLTITPPENSNDSIDLSISATTTEADGDTATTTSTLTVDVAAVNDGPQAVDDSLSGSEDQAFTFTAEQLLANDTDIDGDTLTVQSVEQPEFGTIVDNGNGTYTFTPDENWNGQTDFTYTATDGEGGTSQGTVTVDIGGVNDGPVAADDSLNASEDQPITFSAADLLANDTDSDGGSLSITAFDQPDDGTIVDNGNGTFTFTPDANWSGDTDFSYTISDGQGGTSEATVSIGVEGVADAPNLAMADVTGREDSAITLNIDPSLIDTDGSESLSITIGDIPSGATLEYVDQSGNLQEITVTDGSAELTTAQLNGLQITPDNNYDGSFDLTVSATSTEGDASGDTATTTGTLTVDVAAVADEATLTLGAASGTEDTAIPLSIAVTAEDDIAAVTISGVPNGATLTYVDDQGATQTLTVTDNTVSLEPAQLNGLAITPPQNSDVDFALTVSATTTDGSDSETVSGTLNVSVDPDADAPSLNMADVTGVEDSAIPLNIDPGLTDADGSESLSITVSDIPEGATMSYVDGDGVTQPLTITNNSVELTPDQLSGLTITPVDNFDGSFDLSVVATSTEADGGDTATTSGTLTVDVTEDADGATLTLVDVTGTEDTAIPLNIEVTADDNIALVTIADVPEGASLSAGLDNGDGTWTLTAAQVDGLTLTPPTDSDQDFTLTVSAMTVDGRYSTTVEGTMDVSVAADADAPTLNLTDGAGAEDSAIALDITSALTDTDGSENLSITLGDIPEGSTLSYVDGSGATQSITVDGTTAQLEPDQLNGLQITPPENFDGSFDLSVTATSTEDNGGDTAATTGTLTVDVAAVADEADLTLTDVSGTEDQAISLNIGVTADDDIASVNLTDIPDGATLTYVDGTGATQEITVTDGSAELSTDQLNGLQITPPADSDADFTLGVSATTTDGSDSTTVSDTLEVTVAADADAPTLTVDLGDGVVTSGNATETDVSITSENFSETGSGFTVTARSVGNDGNLSEASVDNVSTGGGGFGVSGSASGPDYQLGYDQDPEQSEQLIVDFDNDVTEISFDFGKAFTNEGGSGADEQGHYEIFRDGVKVGEGDFVSAGGDKGTVTVTAEDGGSFDQIVFSASDGYDETGSGSGDGSDFVITGIDFTHVEGGDTSVTYPLEISSSLTDTDGSETLSITVDGLPDGAVLSAGEENEDGSWTLSSDELEGLEITVSGDDPGQSFDISVTATATETEGGDTSSVTVNAAAAGTEVDSSAEGATISAEDASGAEDSAIALDIDVSLIDTDGSESASITITGVPEGAELSAGSENEDGSWTLEVADLNGLTVTPAADSDADFQLTVSVTTTEENGGETSTSVGTLDVSVAADADAPTLTLADGAGSEDTAIALNINPGLTDTDGSESLSITIGDIPAGAILNYVDGNGATQEITVDNGSADLSPEQLNGLTITPADNFDGSFDLSVTATSTEANGGDTATTTGTLTVDVAADADEATLTLGDVSGTEDEAISLNIGVTADDDIASVNMTDIPDGATLTYVDGNGATQEITVTDGSAELSTDQLNGLQITPPADSDSDFTLSVSATTTDGSDSATVSGTLNVSVAADADAPVLNTADSAGSEDTAIALDITSALTDTDNSETLSITIGDIPEGSTLSYVDGNGATQSITVDGSTAQLGPDQLTGLTITPPENFDGSFDLSISATSTEENGGDTATTTGTLTVDVEAVADEAELNLSNASGTEDQAISLDIAVTADDDIASVNLTDIPDGATLTYVDGNGATQGITITDGSAELSTDQLNGLKIMPPADSDADFTLSVSATTTDGSDSTTVSGTMDVSVAADADAPTLTLTGGAGDEDTAIALNIDPGLTDTDGSESLSITIGDIPAGATLNYVDGDGISQQITVTDGSADLSSEQLNGLTITPAQDFDGSFELSVTATSTEADGGDAETTTGVLTVDVAPVDDSVDGSTVETSNASGNEDTAIALNIDVTQLDTDGSETVSITITDVPDGAVLSNGTENEDGSWTLSAADLDGLTITPAADSNEDFQLGISVTTTEADGGDSSTVTATLDVDVAGVADAPTATVQDDTGTEDNWIQMHLDSALGDTDGSESLTITISDVPEGALLAPGTDNGDGTWSVSAAELPDVCILPADDFNGEITMTLNVTSTENDGDTSTTSQAFTITVDADADEATLTLSDVSGTEDQAISLNIGVTADDDIASITLADIPDGATLTYVDGAGATQEIAVTDGSVELTTDQLNGLQITPPENSDADFALTVSATTTDGSDSATVSGTMDVSVAADADAPTLNLSDGAGNEDTAIALDISSALTDTDGSKSLSITIGDIPAGATLNYVDEGGNTVEITVSGGSADLSPAQLNGLSLTPAQDYNGSFDLSVTSTSTEGEGGDTSVSTGTLTVDVAAVDDSVEGSTVEATNASGNEDTSIALDIDVTQLDTDGSETVSITITDVPDGAVLSNGTKNEDGSWTLDVADLEGLTVTPAADSNVDFQLGIAVTTTEADGGESSTVTATLDVDVAGVADAPTLTVTLGDPELVTTGGDPVDVTINSANVHETGNGFTVTARSIDENGQLTDATVENVADQSGGPTGFGVAGSASGADSEIGFDDASGQSEQLIITFDDDVTSVDVSLAWQHGGEDAHYELYQDGVKVGEGTIEGGTDGVDDVGTFTADGGASFDQIIFSAPASGDDFLVNSISFEATEGGETVVEYPLDITSSVTDIDASETLSITIDGLPEGASLSAGSENEDGSWTLEASDLANLTITTPSNAPEFDLQITATATENDGDTNSVSTTASVDSYDTTAEGATVETSSASGNEDTAIALNIDATLIDADSETMSITIGDVPSGAVLSAGSVNEDGTWTLGADDLDGLTITPASNSNEDFQLSVSVTTTEANGGDTTTTTATLDVDVAGVADAPTLSVSTELTGVGTAETDVDVPQAITDVADGNSITVSGVPSGATLSAGTDNGDGSWTLASGDLNDLTVTPADGSTDEFSLSFDVTETGGGDTVVSENFTGGVSGWSGHAVGSNNQMYLGSDGTSTKTFDFGQEHAGQTVIITFDSDAGSGWEETGSARDYFKVEANDQEVVNTSESSGMSHSLTVTLDANGRVKLEMTTDTTASSEGVFVDNLVITTGDDWESSLASDSVSVTPDIGGAVYDLDITSALTDTDTSETLSIVVDGLPDGTELSAGTENPDGSWTLTTGDLADLTMTVPGGAAEFNLQVSATATEDDGDTNTVSTSVTIAEVDMTVDGVTLETSAASGNEDSAIALSIDAALLDTDGSESMSITISDVPTGATLSAGSDNGDGSWTLAADDLDGLTIVPAEDSSTDFQLGISVTTTEASTGETTTSTATLDVAVDGVADAPELSVTLGAGSEIAEAATPVAYWKLDENDGWADEGQTIYDAVGNHDGAVGESGQDLNDTGVFYKAAEFKEDNDDVIEVPHSDDLKPDNGTLTLWFNTDDANNGTLASSDSSGFDSGGHFDLSIDNGRLVLRMQDTGSSHTITSSGSNGTVSTNEWNQVTVSWGEDGMKMFMNGEMVASDSSYTGGLSGNNNPWTFGASQSRSGNNVADNLRDHFDGHLDDIAIYDKQLSNDEVNDLFDDGVQAVMDAGGDVQGIEFPLAITTNLTDTDGSESLAITIEGLPVDAILSAGTDNGDGTWTLGTDELADLTVTVPSGTDDFAMTVTATATDEGGDTLSVTEIVPVDVADDGFDADVSGTSGADTLTGTSDADVIDAGAGNDQIDAGAGDDIVMAGDGDDTVVGGAGDDVIDGGDGNDTIDGGAGDDSAMGGDGNDLFIFGAGDGSDYFDGGDGWSDTIQLEDVSGGPGADSGWALQVEGDIGYTQTENGIEFDQEVAGSITLSDGSELTFEGVEKLEW